MDSIKKFIIGLVSLWFLLAIAPIVIVYMVLHMIYQFGAYIVNTFGVKEE